MKEYDEDEALKAMGAALGENAPSNEDLYQVLDLIFDYYGENGELEIDAEADDDTDIDEMVAFIAKYLKGKSDSTLTTEQIKTLILAEIAYEDSLL